VAVRKIVFVCVENSARSQMAEAFAKKYAPKDFEILSGGTMPAREVNPTVVEVMREKGIDLSGNIPKPVTPEMVEGADVIVTMGCEAENFCPAPLLKRVIDWGIPSPKSKSVDEVRAIRDRIEEKVKKLLEEMR
jgi:arsenate reductase